MHQAHSVTFITTKTEICKLVIIWTGRHALHVCQQRAFTLNTTLKQWKPLRYLLGIIVEYYLVCQSATLTSEGREARDVLMKGDQPTTRLTSSLTTDDTPVASCIHRHTLHPCVPLLMDYAHHQNENNTLRPSVLLILQAK